MNNLSDNEIIKALECCSKITFSCDGCPLQHLKYSECYELVIRSTLDLINRQKAEIERLAEDNREWETQFRILDVECERLEKANEKQKAEIEKCENIIRLADKTIERQSSELETLQKTFEDMTEGAIIAIKAAQNGAVKEFAERLKAEKQLVKARLDDIGECILYGVLCGDIDNLVKEMVGEG